MAVYCDVKIDFSIYGDICIADGDIALDSTLKTAIIISLFSDARVPESIGYDRDRRGYWGDTIDPDTGETGSLLWTQDRARLNQQTIEDRKTFCTRALQWLVVDGIADSIGVSVERSLKNVDAITTKIAINKNNHTIGELSF